MTKPPHAWIERNNPSQLRWIADYLGRTHPVFHQAFMADNFMYPERVTFLIKTIESHMVDPLFRESYGKLRNAWRQKKVRQKLDKKSATFLLPVSTLSTLEKLAKQRHHTKVTVLNTVIADAWHNYQRANKDIQKTKTTYQQQLKAQRAQYEKNERNYQHVIKTLLEAMAEQIDQQCSLEAKIGGPDSSPLEAGEIEMYEALVEPRLAALTPHLKNLTFNGESLTKRLEDRLEDLAQARKQAAEVQAKLGKS